MSDETISLENKNDKNGSIDWSMCILCQENKSENLQCPANSRRADFGAGYRRMAENMEGFFEINSMPFNIQEHQLNDGSGLYNSFMKNKASWHISCKDKVNGTKLLRAQKRQGTHEVYGNISPKKTRRESLTTNDTREPRCFFCNEVAGSLTLHKASTLEMDRNVRRSATLLHRTDLLAKLSAGDMVAIDAMYHAKCLSALYNDVRTKESKSKSKEEKSYSSLHGLAFASLVSYLEEYPPGDNDVNVFKLADLVKLYSERLENLGCPKSHTNVNSTRLKERLLASVQGLGSYTHGKHVYFAFNKEVGAAIQKAYDVDYDSEALHMAKAAKCVHRDVMKMKQSFNGSFKYGCQKESVPASLLALVEMLLEGPNKLKNGTSEEDQQLRTASLTIAQLVTFNMCKQESKAKTRYRGRDRECPLPIYTALKIHGQTRKRTLVDTFHSLGMCISYDRVLDISTDLANSVTALFELEEAVCPPKLKKDLFTTGEVDNIDHNPSSTKSSDSFHGTAITLIQHPTEDNRGSERETNPVDVLAHNQNHIGMISRK